MRFPVYFKRDAGGASNGNPVLGSDTAPTFASDKDNSSAGNPFKKDTILAHKLQFDRPTNRIAIGYWFDSAMPVTLPCDVWVWDSKSEKWFKAGSGTLTSGQLTYVRIPYLADPPQTQALNPNLETPNQGLLAMLVVSDNTSPSGIVHIAAGPDSAFF